MAAENLNMSLKRLTRKGNDKNLISIQRQHVQRLERTAISREDAWHPHRLHVL